MEILFCVDWQSVVMTVSLLWLPNSTLNLVTLVVRSSVARINGQLLVFFFIYLILNKTYTG